MGLTGACSSTAKRRLAATDDAGPLGRATIEVSPQKVADGAPLKVTISFGSAEDPQDPSRLGGSLGETTFPFFAVQKSQKKTGRVYAALVGVPYGSEPGVHHLQIHLAAGGGRTLASLTESPDFTRDVAFEIEPGKYRSETLKVDPDKVEPPESAKPRIEAEQQEINAVYGTLLTEEYLLSGFRKPITTGVTSPFGSKRLYNGTFKNFHNGVDLRAATGRRISAAAPGVVALAKELYYTGNTVILDHGYGVFTLYGHMSKIRVEKGAVVKQGQLLGNAGSTGRVTGPHLHWGAVLHGVKVNALELTKITW